MPKTTVSHKGLGIEVALDFSIRPTIAFEKAFVALKERIDAGERISAREYGLEVVLQAIESGVLALSQKAIEADWQPAAIEWLSTEIALAYQAATTISPE